MKLNMRTRSLKEVRKDTLIPGVIYGRTFPSTKIEIGEKDFKELLHKYGKSMTFQVSLNKEKHTVYIKHVQYDAMNRAKIIHFDLHCLQKDEKITAKIPIVFIGKDEVEKNHLFIQMSMNEIECEYPVNEKIHDFTFDVTHYKYDDSVHVKDIKTPKNVKILEDPNQMVFIIKQASKSMTLKVESQDTLETPDQVQETEE